MSELVADGIPVAVACRVLKLARQPYYRWLAGPVTDVEWVQAHRANALFDAHRDDPEFGYRYLLDEARDAGQVMAARTGWLICRENRWFSVFGKTRRGKAGRVGPPVHDDRVQRDFTAMAANELWLTDMPPQAGGAPTEHRTDEGKFCVTNCHLILRQTPLSAENWRGLAPNGRVVVVAVCFALGVDPDGARSGAVHARGRGLRGIWSSSRVGPRLPAWRRRP